MKTIILGCLFVALSTATGHTGQLSRWFSGTRTSHEARHTHHRRPLDATHVYEPPRPRFSNPEYTEGKFPLFKAAFLYPYVTGTSILDEYSGRVPVIARSECSYPSRSWFVAGEERDYKTP